MKKILLISLSLIVTFNISNAQDELINRVKNENISESKLIFKDHIILKHTPIKNQGKSGTCWSYASISFIESEILRNGGDELDLSEIFVARKLYEEKAYRYVMLHGIGIFAQGGAVNDVIDVIKTYGMVPQNIYTGLTKNQNLNDHYELDDAMNGFLNGVIRTKDRHPGNVWKDATNKILDVYLGEIPSEFDYNGKKYTPKSFSEKILKINTDDYMYFTSLSYSPFYKKTAIIVPDNWSWKNDYNNVPIDDLIKIIDYSLENGYTVSFGADVSEKGFSLENGFALVPEKEFDNMTEKEINYPIKEKTITDELRLESFENYQTTDDHGMHIIGTAKDQYDNEYYKIKNSWGTERGKGNGYMYFSKSFMKYKVLSILVHRKGIPSDILNKIGN